MRVDSARSAQSATTSGVLSPSSRSASPNPSRVYASSSLFMFACDLALHGPELLQEPPGLLLTRRLAVPAIIKFDLLHPLAWDVVRNDDGRLFINSFRLLDR